MKKTAILMCAMLCITMFISCKKEQIKTGNNISTKDTVVTPKNDLKQFEQEGFISKDLFRIIVVRPAGSDTSDEDIQKQAQNKTLASLKRYITSTGKMLQPNSDAQLLNLISGYGKLTPHDDADAKRTIFVEEISKPGLKSYVENLGK